jgi:hypothetical protein
MVKDSKLKQRFRSNSDYMSTPKAYIITEYPSTEHGEEEFT